MKIEPSTQTARTEVKRGFVLSDTEPVPWRDGKDMVPEFLEVLYTDDHGGKGWRWWATVRGRRVNAGGTIGAADATLTFFSGHGDTPAWVLDTAVKHLPTEAGETIADWATERTDFGTYLKNAYTGAGKPREGTEIYGLLRGRYPVTVKTMGYSGAFVRLTAVNPKDASIMNRDFTLLEFVPDEVVPR
ncbi:MAG: hypothetical protein HOY78_02575 [Saccharothrix sp.]|nr:hypothetical protein [Saccharothrix sp.]